MRTPIGHWGIAVLVTSALWCGCASDQAGGNPVAGEVPGGEDAGTLMPPGPTGDAGDSSVTTPGFPDGGPEVVIEPPEPETPVAPIRLEAELGILRGTTIATSRKGYSGTGYVTGFDADTDSVTMSVEVPRAGVYLLTVGAAADADKTADIAVNGKKVTSTTFIKSAAFAEMQAGKIWLENGKNTIGIVKGWGWYDVDYIIVQSAPPSNRSYNVPDALVTPNASDETKALFRYLRSIYGKKILSGQYGSAGVEREHVFKTTGKWPAVGGFDFGEYSPTCPRSNDGATESALAWAKNKRGIVTFSWHWFSPSGATSENSFYTKETSFDLTKALVAGAPENVALLRDLDAIAVELTKLRDAGVPVLWRPLHEAEGKWFWWGAKGSGPAIQLYKLMFERYTKQHKLNNLIWVWNSESKEWYPGHDIVDIVSADVYSDAKNYDVASSRFEGLWALGEGKKMIAMSENGPIPDPDRMPRFDARWSWFCTWMNEFVVGETNNTYDYLKRVYKHDYVITLDELPALPISGR